MFRGNIGTRTGRNVLEGKEIHCDSAGFDNFEDYFTDSDSSLPEKTVVDTVVQPTVKSFINPEPSIRDGDSPLSKIPSKKRLSFRTEAASDSDSSSIASFQQRSRLISKRGMRSFPGEDEGDEEKWSSEPFSPFSAPIKTYTPGSKGSVSSHTHSEKKRVQRISNRGMKSFPDDEEEEEEDDLCVYEILDDSPVQLPPEPIVMKKIVALEQRLILSALGKENEENLCRIQNNENTQQLSPKSTSRVSPSIVKVNPNVGKKTTKSMPVQNWYIWDDDSLLDGAKMIITPYGVHADTGVKNKFPDLGSNLHVIDEDEPQQSSRKNWKSKMPHLVRLSSDESASEKGQTHQERTKSSKEKQTKTLPRKKSPVKPTVKKVLPQSHVSNGKPSKDLSDEEETSVIESSEVEVLVTDGVNSVDKNSEERSESAETEESSTLVAESTDEEWKASKSKKKVRKPEVSPLRKRISLRHKTPSTGKKTSSAKRTLGSRKTKSLPAKEKRKSREPSPRNRKALTGGKKSQSLDRKKEEVKKTVSSLTKGKVSLTKKNEPVNTRNGKRTPSLSPEMKSSAKRGKLNYKSPSSPSNGKGSPSKKNEPVHTKSGKRASSSSPKSKIPTKLRKLNNRSPPSPSYMTRSSASNKSMSPVKTQKKMGSRKNEEVKSNSGPKTAPQKTESKKPSIPTLPVLRRLSKRISAGKSKSPAKTNPVQKDTNESDNTSSEEVTDWKCEGCEALIPVSLEACIFCGLCKQNVSQDAEIQMSPHGSSPSTYYRNILSNMRGKNKKTSPQKLKDKQPKSPKGKTSKLESPVLQNTSPKTMRKQKSSFIMKTSYKFNSYENLKMDHRVSYCVCSQSDTAIIGMMKLQRGGYRKSNYSLKEMCFTVLDGQVTVHIDQEKRELSAHDTFIVAVDGEYSIKNNNTRNACLIFTIIK